MAAKSLLTVRCSDTELQRWKRLAAREGMSLSDLVRVLLAQAARGARTQ